MLNCHIFVNDFLVKHAFIPNLSQTPFSDSTFRPSHAFTPTTPSFTYSPIIQNYMLFSEIILMYTPHFPVLFKHLPLGPLLEQATPLPTLPGNMSLLQSTRILQSFLHFTLIVFIKNNNLCLNYSYYKS